MSSEEVDFLDTPARFAAWIVFGFLVMSILDENVASGVAPFVRVFARVITMLAWFIISLALLAFAGLESRFSSRETELEASITAESLVNAETLVDLDDEAVVAVVSDEGTDVDSEVAPSEEITYLQDVRRNLEEQVEELEEEKGLLSARFESCKTQLYEAEEEVAKLQARLVTPDTEELARQQAVLAREVKAHRATRRELGLARVKPQYANAGSQVEESQVRRDFEVVVEEKVVVAGPITNQASRIDDGLLEEYKSQIAGLKKEIEDLQTKLQTTESSASTTIDQLRGRVQELEGTESGASTTINQLQGRVQELEGGENATITHLRQQLAERDQNLQQYQIREQAQSQSNEALQLRVQQHENGESATIFTLREQVASLGSDLQQSQINVQSQDQTINGLRGQVASQSVELQQSQVNAENQNQTLESLRSRLQEYENESSTVSSLREQIAARDFRLTEQREMIYNLNTQLVNQTADLDAKQTQLADQGIQLAVQSAQIDAKDTELQQFRADAQALVSQNEIALREEIANQDTTIQYLKSRLHESESDALASSTKVTEQEEELGKLREETGARKNNVIMLRKRITELEKRNSMLQPKVAFVSKPAPTPPQEIEPVQDDVQPILASNPIIAPQVHDTSAANSTDVEMETETVCNDSQEVVDELRRAYVRASNCLAALSELVEEHSPGLLVFQGNPAVLFAPLEKGQERNTSLMRARLDGMGPFFREIAKKLSDEHCEWSKSKYLLLKSLEKGPGWPRFRKLHEQLNIAKKLGLLHRGRTADWEVAGSLLAPGVNW